MRSMLLVTLILLAGPAHGQEGKAKPRRTPDHLVPLNPYRDWKEKKYIDLIREKLELPEVDDHKPVVMIARPSFEPEEALVLDEIPENENTFKLLHTKASRNIWFWMFEHNDGGNIKQGVTVARHEAILPAAVARRVCRLWERMLRGVRYPDEEPFGVDGETFEFWCDGMYGETWNPEGASTLQFVELGLSLIAYCDLPEGKRTAALKEIEENCHQLEASLE